MVHSKLRRATKMRAQADEMLAQARHTLIALPSHELHTPLTYIANGFELLAEELANHPAEALSEDMQISMALIRGGTERLNRLAEQAALYVQITGGQVASRVRSSSALLSMGLLLYDALAYLPGSARFRVQKQAGKPVYIPTHWAHCAVRCYTAAQQQLERKSWLSCVAYCLRQGWLRCWSPQQGRKKPCPRRYTSSLLSKN